MWEKNKHSCCLLFVCHRLKTRTYRTSVSITATLVSSRAVVSLLLKAGFPVSALSPAGTALHEAALCGKLEVVRCLLESGVALNAKDQGGLTVLEVLAQFPAHLTHEMSALITRHSEYIVSFKVWGTTIVQL